MAKVRRKVSTRQRLIEYLSMIGGTASAIPNPGKKSDPNLTLFNLFLWQEVKKYADEQLKKLWASAQDNARIIQTDDDLRSLGKGEHIVMESDSFSALIEVQNPRLTLDRDLFIAAIARDYSIPIDELLLLAEKCCKEGKAPLSKRILEA